MKPQTAYAILITTPRTRRKELAIFDARLPIFWRHAVAGKFNGERCGGLGEIVEVTIRQRSKKKAAQAALKKAS